MIVARGLGRGGAGALVSYGFGLSSSVVVSPPTGSVGGGWRRSYPILAQPARRQWLQARSIVTRIAFGQPEIRRVILTPAIIRAEPTVIVGAVGKATVRLGIEPTSPGFLLAMMEALE